MLLTDTNLIITGQMRHVVLDACLLQVSWNTDFILLLRFKHFI